MLNIGTLAELGETLSGLAGCATVWWGIHVYRRERRERIAAGALESQKPAGHIAAASPYLTPCVHFASTVSEWFTERFAKFEAFAKAEGLRSLDPALQKSVLEQIAREVQGFPGGIYAIDEAKVSAQQTPHARDVPDITGYEVKSRPYYDACIRQRKSIASYAFLSANREVQILVVATPRFDHAGRLIGILDGVIDIISAPFSEMAKYALTISGLNTLHSKARLILIDQKGVVIGSSHGVVDGTRNIGGHPTVETLRRGIADAETYASEDGAISCVAGTEYYTVCYDAR